jgi:cyclopropane fatty-acyl-phospholipid synthase-like methyltransferase
MSEAAASVALQTEAYYDSDAADSFYSEIWGGNDIHIGIYGHESDSVRAASSRTVATMATRLAGLDDHTRALDLGAGYGGAGRYLAALYDCQVDCLNLSEVQNETNRKLCEQAGLESRVRVVHGSFESIPSADGVYDVVWSQDAILHSGARDRVLAEIARVSTPGARLVFTDPMQTDDCPPDVLQPVLDRIHLDSLASPGFYRKSLSALGFEERSWTPMPGQLRRHYATVAAELDARSEEMSRRCGEDYVARMRQGLQHWVDAADRGHLTWGIFHFRKRA